jgi:hypothetical protein
VRVLAEARPERPLVAAPSDAPLTPQEVARMKEHFRFLREHRHALKLRVNAAEDLLLNGSREPTHRGVCRHLLEKVERARVLAVSERLPAAEATRFLAGVLRFAPELPYVIRFLECVRASASQEQAAAALNHALRHLDFAETSAAQVRQILLLIVEVFPPREMPVLLLSLLAGAPFREALDRSAEALPASLAEMVLPLRAARAALFRDGRLGGEQGELGQRHGVEDLERGVLLLLEGARESLLELEPGQRRRLFELGCEALRGTRAPADQAVERLADLMRSLPFSNEGERLGAVRRFIGVLLAADQPARARALLDEEIRKHADAPFARWRKLLDAPRVGSVALEPPEGRHGRGERESAAPGELLPPGRWYRGWHVPTQTAVRLRYGEAADEPRFVALVELWQRVLVPGVERIVEHGGGERPYLAMKSAGRSLARALGEPRGIDTATYRDWCLEACQLLASLSRSGVVLPDAAPNRFSVDPAARLWLVDPWGAESRPADLAERAHVEHAKQLLSTILDAPRTPPLSRAAREALNGAENFEQLVAALERG